MPPSSNNLYASVNGRLVKSKEGRVYSQTCDIWALKNFRVIEAIRKAVESTKYPFAIELDATFVFLNARIVGKNNKLKKIDASNRLKSLHDNFARLCHFDDSQIIGGAFEKVTCDNSRDEGVILKLRLAKLKTLTEVLEETVVTSMNA